MYEEQANIFAKKYNLTMDVSYYKYGKHFIDDESPRHIFKIELLRTNIPCGRECERTRRYSCEFGQSISAGKKPPTLYEVLACLTKYDPGSYENFKSDYGYEPYTIEEDTKTKIIYDSVEGEWYCIEYLFKDCLEELREIN